MRENGEGVWIKFLRIPSGELTVPILQILDQSRSQTGLTSLPLRWTELKERLGFSGSHGSLAKCLGALEREGLVRKRRGPSYEITFEGRWVLHKGPAESPPELPPDVKRLMEIHGYVEPTPTQLEFLQNRELLNSRRNLCIFAAPDQGKTFLAEILMLRALHAGEKILYLTTHKSINREKHELLREVFSNFGVRPERVDSDTPTPPEDLRKAKIVVATYERALGGLRPGERWSIGRKLVVAEGAEILGDEIRGVNVDLLLTELKRRRVRIVALSARVGNEEDLAGWLSAEKFISPHAWSRKEGLAIIREKKSKCLILERPGEPRLEVPLRRRWYPVH